ncbi:MAG: hypothetical protein AAAB20_03845 [Rhizobium sp.]|jgi:hypothetical protein|uniref:hypothetical protein n=1 Tax=unclassified Rhizobium TaxID=2613769 RepID=UPI00055F627B
MQQVELEGTDFTMATRVWSVPEFCARHRLDNNEEARLTALFGPFATAAELMHNMTRAPKFR